MVPIRDFTLKKMRVTLRRITGGITKMSKMLKIDVSNVHEALSRAVETEKDRVALVNANFKIHPLRKELAEGICEKNATTLSAYLRECCDLLLVDYLGPKEASRIGITITA